MKSARGIYKQQDLCRFYDPSMAIKDIWGWEYATTNDICLFVCLFVCFLVCFISCLFVCLFVCSDNIVAMQSDRLAL